jgi:hypothetical protein
MLLFIGLFSIAISNVRDTLKPVERYCDSAHIGRKGLNMVRIIKYDLSVFDTAAYLPDSVVIKFYSKKEGHWVKKNEFHLKGNSPDLDPKFKDFNNDGFKDLTYQSDLALRGANELRTLFIYDSSNDKLIHIKNSANFPNLAYNRTLNCIDAWVFHGGCSTVFLRLKGDKLKEFAAVQVIDNVRTVTTFDKSGKEKIILHDTSTTELGFPHYKNYNPLRE